VGIWGKSPRSWRIFENFCVKRNLTRLLLTVSYRKKLGEQDVVVAPPIIVTPTLPVPGLFVGTDLSYKDEE